MITKCFLEVVAARDLEVQQVDVHYAFLHSDLVEEVFMKLLHGFLWRTRMKYVDYTNFFMVLKRIEMLLCQVDKSDKRIWFCAINI